jgi:hypothetical protein
MLALLSAAVAAALLLPLAMIGRPTCAFTADVPNVFFSGMQAVVAVTGSTGTCRR